IDAEFLLRQTDVAVGTVLGLRAGHRERLGREKAHANGAVRAARPVTAFDRAVPARLREVALTGALRAALDVGLAVVADRASARGDAQHESQGLAHEPGHYISSDWTVKALKRMPFAAGVTDGRSGGAQCATVSAPLPHGARVAIQGARAVSACADPRRGLCC